VRFSTFDLSQVIFPRQKGTFVILASYGDDSTDKQSKNVEDKRVLCAGSFLGWPETFIEVENKWIKRLGRDGIDYFRASECEGLVEQFDPVARAMSLNSARAMADSVRRDLSDIIGYSSGLGGICISLLLEDFHKVLKSDPRGLVYFGNDPAVYVYATLIKKTIDLLDNDWPESKGIPIAFEFDTHTKWKEAEEAYRNLNKVPRFAARLAHIGHADDKKFPPLQMADLMAHEGRHQTHKYLDSSRKDRFSFAVLAESNAVYYCGLIDEAAMIAEMDEHDVLTRQ
jgi:hypothetical protein